MHRYLLPVFGLLGIGWLAAQDAIRPDPDSPRPIDAVDTVFIEDMTWMEVRDARNAGKSTVIIATGGVEQNGPYLVTGKHNVVLRGTTEAIARKLGNALVAPIVPFVPEGDYDPPTVHMRYPGTISLREDTFERLLTDICTSFKVHQFDTLVLIGDSGGNQKGMKNVAAKLTAQWQGKPAVYYVPEYYDYGAVTKWVAAQGVKQKSEGLHDDFVITAQMLAVDPKSVRAEQRIKAKKFRINGVDLAPIEKSIEWGKKITAYRADMTIKALQKQMKK